MAEEIVNKSILVRTGLVPIVIALAIAVTAPSTVFACEKTFDGAEFLKAAQARGIGPAIEGCYLVNLAENIFYARPDTVCSVFLESSKWLAEGWNFSSLTGVGPGFSVDGTANGLTVTIEKEGGFVLNSITVDTSEYECEAVELEQVLH